ncbi:methionine ABC transporter ATP-binding protein [uncultured Tateyamaria sp.]|uniref:methionine ABC transporter ATP-binding protein n=1 Tax=uncultured Tateyamaria sp. TaxID=455651 RepID=UPI00260F60D2|nr:methionine ABC transporter ATP-binding protein [uncultured Tateyamaria sp.]
MTADTVISCKNVWKIFGPDPEKYLRSMPADHSFDDIRADGYIAGVKDVSIDVSRGEMLVIMGLSGSGKSTLVRCFSRLHDITGGSIVVEGQDIMSLSEKELIELRRNKMGMVFQSFGLLPHRTVLENVAFPLEMRGQDKHTRRERALEVVKLVGLEGREEYFPRELSGGQQQRVGIARALASNPDVLLCDEATSALDPDTTDQVLDLLVELNRSIGVTVVLITHELGVLRRICTSAARLDDGRIAETGRILDLVGTPGSALGAAIVPVGDDPSAGDDADSALVTTIGDEAHGPWLAQLVRKLDVDISVVGGRVEQVAGVTVGRLRLKFGSDAPRGDIEAFVEAQPGTTLSWGPESRIEGRIA